VQAQEGSARQGELDHQLLARLAGRIVCRAGVDLVDMAVGQAQRDIEFGGLSRLAEVIPEARRDLVDHERSPLSLRGRQRRSDEATSQPWASPAFAQPAGRSYISQPCS